MQAPKWLEPKWLRCCLPQRAHAEREAPRAISAATIGTHATQGIMHGTTVDVHGAEAVLLFALFPLGTSGGRTRSRLARAQTPLPSDQVTRKRDQGPLTAGERFTQTSATDNRADKPRAAAQNRPSSLQRRPEQGRQMAARKEQLYCSPHCLPRRSTSRDMTHTDAHTPPSDTSCRAGPRTWEPYSHLQTSRRPQVTLAIRFKKYPRPTRTLLLSFQ